MGACVAAVSEYKLPRNPIAGIEDIDTGTHFTYSEEDHRTRCSRKKCRCSWGESDDCFRSTSPSWRWGSRRG